MFRWFAGKQIRNAAVSRRKIGEVTTLAGLATFTHPFPIIKNDHKYFTLVVLKKLYQFVLKSKKYITI